MSKFLFVSVLSVCLGAPLVHAQTIGDVGKEDHDVTVIEPVKKAKEIKSAAIDDERFELGAYLGVISLEDFNTVSMLGLSASYHVFPKWILSVAYGKSGSPEAAFEQQEDGDFVEDRDAGFEYVSLLGSYQLLEGRSFLGVNKKYSTHLFVDAGVEDVTFAGESQTGVVFGATYKMVLTDWLTTDLRMRDHVVERTFLGDEKTTHNIEMVLALQALF